MIGEYTRPGIAVSGDIAIYNDPEIATEIVPAITIIRVPRDQIGRIARVQII